MNETYEHGHQLRALAMRVTALEDNVAFLEQWCEEQQDQLDRSVGPVGYDYEVGGEAAPAAPRVLRVVDVRDGLDAEDGNDEDAIVALVETDYDRRIRQIRAQLNRVRTRLAASLAPPAERPPERPAARRPAARRISVKPAGRTAP